MKNLEWLDTDKLEIGVELASEPKVILLAKESPFRIKTGHVIGLLSWAWGTNGLFATARNYRILYEERSELRIWTLGQSREEVSARY